MMPDKASLAFAPMYDTPGRHDATGAFQPEAKRWLAYWKLPTYPNLVLVDNHQSAERMRRQVTRAIDDHMRSGSQPACYAFFCHGTSKSIQFGFRKAEVHDLAAPLARHGSMVRVPLYCCLTASGDEGHGGDGGFADLLRDALCEQNAVNCCVDGHTTAGHTTRNPYVRRFQGDGSAFGGTGGKFIVAPRNGLWGRWRAALKGDLRFQFPMLTTAEIVARLHF